MAKKNSKAVYVVALLLFLGGLGYLLVSGLGENSAYFLNVAEALKMQPDALAKARLFGSVAPDGLKRPDDALGVTFRLVDKDDTARSIWVDYRGAVPDTFKPGIEVIVEGGVNPSTGVFGATTLMTKCPSKYQKENRS